MTSGAARVLRAFAIVVAALATACAGRAVSQAGAALPPGAQLASAASLTAEWCRGVRRNDICEKFRDVSVEEVVRFEQQFPAILRAKGFPHEAESLPDLQRFYWGVLRERRLYVRGSLVCRDRLTADGVILLVAKCPAIDVTFPAGHPQQVEVLID